MTAIRRFFLLFDGSGDVAAAAKQFVPTNITRLNRAFTPGFEQNVQIIHYFSGVGTHNDQIARVTGRGLDQIVIDGYVALASNFTPGDEIYVFGYSRGAVAARLLCELISDVGLLSADQLELFADVWRCLTVTDNGTLPEIRKKLFEVTDMKPHISFLGLFDTVPGTSWDLLHSFTNLEITRTRLAEQIDVAVQILALDEDRLFFSPTIWESCGDSQIMEQIWMPGVHADIGGSSQSRILGLCSLFTMLERIELYCPQVEQDSSEIGIMSEELSGIDRIDICGEPRRGLRLVSHQPRPVTAGPSVFMHPIYRLLSGNDLWMYGKKVKYNPSNASSLIPILDAIDEVTFSGETFLPRVMARTKDLLTTV